MPIAPKRHGPHLESRGSKGQWHSNTKLSFKLEMILPVALRNERGHEMAQQREAPSCH